MRRHSVLDQLLLRAAPALLLAWVVMLLSQSKELPTELTWPQLLTVVSLVLFLVGGYRLIRAFFDLAMNRGSENDEQDTWVDPTAQDELNEMAVSVLTHELAHAIVSHRLGMDVRSVNYSPRSGFCHTDDRRHGEQTVYWAGMAAICAAGLLVPIGEAGRSDQHGNAGLEDDAISLWRKAAYAAAADGQSITHHADEAMRRARELMPDMAEIHREAERLMAPPTNGWRSPSLRRMVPDEDLQAFLRNYDPSAA